MRRLVRYPGEQEQTVTRWATGKLTGLWNGWGIKGEATEVPAGVRAF